MPDRLRLLASAAMAVPLIGVLISACTTGQSREQPDAAGELVAIAEELCRAAAQQDADEAAAGFLRVHGPLHDLAEQVANVDRAVAGQLLRAKQQVEADLDAEAPAPLLSAHLDDLAAASVAGLSSLSLPPPSTCTASEPS